MTPHPFHLAAAAALASLAATAHAEPAAPAGAKTYTLSDAQKQAIEDAKGDAPSDADALALADAPVNGDKGPHGEMGVMVGTGGLRSVYGSIGTGLGQSGSAMAAFETTQFGGRRFRR